MGNGFENVNIVVWDSVKWNCVMKLSSILIDFSHLYADVCDIHGQMQYFVARPFTLFSSQLTRQFKLSLVNTEGVF